MGRDETVCMPSAAEVAGASPDRLDRLVYSSTIFVDAEDDEYDDSREIFMEETMKEILTTSCDFNRTNNVSGVLVYDPKSKVAFQIIEASTSVLVGLYERIARDARHSDITLRVYSSNVEVRKYEGWGMLSGCCPDWKMDDDIENEIPSSKAWRVSTIEAALAEDRMRKFNL